MPNSWDQLFTNANTNSKYREELWTAVPKKPFMKMIFYGIKRDGIKSFMDFITNKFEV